MTTQSYHFIYAEYSQVKSEIRTAIKSKKKNLAGDILRIIDDYESRTHWDHLTHVFDNSGSQVPYLRTHDEVGQYRKKYGYVEPN